ncbi:DUF4279 domain-containing protein [Oceanobacillus jordanicus]|uniref:DUF4279 domain-containing protein n=1 Tax=Oceanobacillus jordanicus TaxID=2867266 RepID=A0AAW5B8I2_9BACI|nr:DUF4279 domain-containing protein [Oceanobacillus jordanicus]
MERTKVRVYFSLFGDTFPLDYVTVKLDITPSTTYTKGDTITHLPTVLVRQETCWELDTGYQESLDVNDQLQKILAQLQNKVFLINEIKMNYSVECKIFIVAEIEDGDTPAIYLDRDIIRFASIIEAEFDIDLYAYPYEESNDELFE